MKNHGPRVFVLFCLPLQYLSYYSPVNSSNIFAIRALSILYRFSFFLSCPAFAYPMFRRSHRCLLLTAASDVPDSPQPVISRIVTVSLSPPCSYRPVTGFHGWLRYSHVQCRYRRACLWPSPSAEKLLLSRETVPGSYYGSYGRESRDR